MTFNTLLVTIKFLLTQFLHDLCSYVCLYFWQGVEITIPSLCDLTIPPIT